MTAGKLVLQDNHALLLDKFLSVSHGMDISCSIALGSTAKQYSGEVSKKEMVVDMPVDQRTPPPNCQDHMRWMSLPKN